MVDEAPSNWELMRLLKTLQETMARMESRMMTNDMFKVHQEGTDRRFTANERALTEWIVESKGEHSRIEAASATRDAEINAQIKEHQDKQEALERLQKDQKNRTWLAVGLAFLSFALTVVGAVVLNSLHRGS